MVPRHIEVVNAFVKYIKQNGDRSLVDGFTSEEIEDAIAKKIDPSKDTRLYEAMMQRINQLNRADKRKRENLKLLYGFILGVIGTIISTWLIKQFF